jgi:hypothetical protein
VLHRAGGGLTSPGRSDFNNWAQPPGFCPLVGGGTLAQ